RIEHFGFVLPKSKQVLLLVVYRIIAIQLPRLACAMQSCARHYLAAPLLLARAGGLPSCRIESPDRKLAPRQRTSFVAIHDRKPLSHVGKNGCEFLRPLWPRPCVVQDAGRKRLQ